ncbi:MAG: Uncharacterised protein [Flavobacterium sp. SCGC AAA160-P02]|nr:MAG: Uncharacterised protein [Flavobacterium sp. SCGC AAA160-P02]
MKKIILVIAIALISFTANAQFGAAVSYGSVKAKVSTSVAGADVSADASTGAFSVGLFYELELSDSMDLLPGVGYSSADGGDAIGLGLDLQYYLGGRDSNFFVGPGVGFGFSLEDVDTDVVSKTSFSVGAGAGFDISDAFTIMAEYSTQLNNSSKVDGIKIKANYFGGTLMVKF